jgi:predicted house-cleaning noncanonical NTP pyrophosphatase (MazG superfamily)
MKLIRDNTPDIDRGEVTTVKGNEVAEELALRCKLMEEAAEVSASTSREELIEEIGDLSVILGLIKKRHNITTDEVEDSIIEKLYKKGGFADFLILKHDPLDNKYKNRS